ncbi:LIC_13387 family protein [Bradyrhizobium sp. SYSU BS000235]|uniref:LIC_13387 family protein n=1 Tax=Bradyrhizobium sp. SYSU BS000235 TaxID=3411332 RepID=UPI003C745012
MSASLLYRVASVLIVLFAAGHQFGFRKVNPAWKAETLVSSMRSLTFDVQGFTRSYWDFYTGFGLFVTVFLLLAALLAWQLGNPELAKLARPLAWGLVLAFAVSTYLSWTYFFIAPLALSSIITVVLIAAAVV